MTNKDIILGSGVPYIVEFTQQLPTNNTELVAALKSNAVEENRLGYIKGGATIEYKPTFYEAKDDLGYVSKNILQAEEATFKTGVMTWNHDVIKKLSSTARIDDTTVAGTSILKVGGIGNDDGKKYLLVFVHNDTDSNGNETVHYVAVAGNNTSGFTLAYQPDKESTIDAEFKAVSGDADGTMIFYAVETTDYSP